MRLNNYVKIYFQFRNKLELMNTYNYTNKNTCDVCNFTCSLKTDMTRHLSTRKHYNNVNKKEMELNYINYMKLHDQTHLCSCGANFKTQSGLWKHKKKCDNIKENKENLEKPEICDKELILSLLKQNAELLELLKNNTNNNNINNFNNCNNNNNNTFNLQVFLNETCKDAMNLSEFIENISLQISDLENIGKLGYVEGVSNIIIKSLNALDVTQRPMHCTDKKREIMYVKDDDEWQKEEDDKKHIKSVISSVVLKNLQLLSEYENKYPECMNPESKKSDEYNKIIMETMGGGVNIIREKNKEKIIRKIAKEVVIEKNT